MEHDALILLHEKQFQDQGERLHNLEVEFKAHLKEYTDMKSRIDRHDETITEIKALRWWLMGTIVTILGAVMIWLVSWGAVTNQININTGRLNKLEEGLDNLEQVVIPLAPVLKK